VQLQQQNCWLHDVFLASQAHSQYFEPFGLPSNADGHEPWQSVQADANKILIGIPVAFSISDNCVVVLSKSVNTKKSVVVCIPAEFLAVTMIS
jgi:hypothetical protein